MRSHRANGNKNARTTSQKRVSSQRSAPTRRRPTQSGSRLNETFVVRAILVIAIVILLVFAFTQCTKTESVTDQNNNPSASTQDQKDNTISVNSDNNVTNLSQDDTSLAPDRTALLRILEEEEVDKLITLTKTNEDALWIAAHPEEFAFEGPEVQYKILKLAADEEEALKYVREFPDKFPTENETTDLNLALSMKSPSQAVPDTRIPHLYQWDRRWAQTVYCSTTFGLTGCGPTALAMVYQGLTGDSSLDPYDLGVMAQNAGYMLQFDGTTDGFFTQTATQIGLNYETPLPTVENITNALANGKCIIANFAPGYFTKYGHFVVLTGLDNNGNIIMNDPYSVVRSSKTWDPELIANETRKMFVYSAG